MIEFPEADLGLMQHPRSNGWLTIITKHSILDVAAALDPPLMISYFLFFNEFQHFANFYDYQILPYIFV